MFCTALRCVCASRKSLITFTKTNTAVIFIILYFELRCYLIIVCRKTISANHFVFRPLLQTNGFFVESGALDGERLSNSLFFEKYRNWRGILIEPHPGSYRILRSKNRKAFSLNSCLSTNTHPAQVITKTCPCNHKEIFSRSKN